MIGDATHINLTQHTYFNLDGLATLPSSGVLDAIAQLSSSRYLIADADTLPTGEIANVAGTVFDFREARAVLPRGESEESFGGYDHAFVLDDSLPFAARVFSPVRGGTFG